MKKEDIIRMADKQGLVDYFDMDGDSVGQLMLCTLVFDCISAEREACAKLCEAYTDNDGGKFIDHEGHGYECAAAIRARGKA